MTRNILNIKTLFVFTIMIYSYVACERKTYVNTEKAKESLMSDIAYRALDSVLIVVGADSGLVVIMDSQNNEIITKASSHRKGDTITHSAYESECIPVIMRSIIYYSALQIEGIDDSIVFNTGNGLYESELPQSKPEKELIRDHNWHRGGYGSISIQRGFVVGSDITSTMTIERAMKNNSKAFVNILKQQNILIGEQDVSFLNLMKIKLSPEEQVKWLNNIAIGGVSTISDEKQRAIKKHQIALRTSVSQGISKIADSKRVEVSGKTFRWESDQNRSPTQYLLGFYGFFPSSNPVCTIYIGLSKPGLPANGSMAAYVFTSIIDQLYNEKFNSHKDSSN